MTNHMARIVVGTVLCAASSGAFAQTVDRTDTSPATPGEIAMAAECRDLHRRMRELDGLLNENRDEMSKLTLTIKRSGQKLDELEKIFDQKSAKSQEGDDAYAAALKAKNEYESAATEHNKLIDQEEEIAKKRTGLSDEFFVVNPDYVRKCSGTVFKANSIILTCKDESSEWCDLLK